jgi:hypothetical protein
MQQAMNLEDFEWHLGSVRTKLSLIHVETLQTQCEVRIEHLDTKKEVRLAHDDFDKKFRAAKSEIKKQSKAMGKVELWEELLSIVPEDSDTAKDLKKKISRICARRAKK